MKAAFLDRDGVIINNSRHYYIHKMEDVNLVDGIFENLKLLQEKGFALFIVSNQGGIAKGEYAKEDIELLHQSLLTEFSAKGISIVDVAFCPHHDKIEKCFCRKPNSVMLEKLIAKYKIDREQSVFLGDSETDMQAAVKVGLKGILITANQSMRPFIEEL